MSSSLHNCMGLVQAHTDFISCFCNQTQQLLFTLPCCGYHSRMAANQGQHLLNSTWFFIGIEKCQLKGLILEWFIWIMMTPGWGESLLAVALPQSGTYTVFPIHFLDFFFQWLCKLLSLWASVNANLCQGTWTSISSLLFTLPVKCYHKVVHMLLKP